LSYEDFEDFAKTVRLETKALGMTQSDDADYNDLLDSPPASKTLAFGFL
jgi:hypothetical protein